MGIENSVWGGWEFENEIGSHMISSAEHLVIKNEYGDKSLLCGTRIPSNATLGYTAGATCKKCANKIRKLTVESQGVTK